jgi:hypothetical protein
MTFDQAQSPRLGQRTTVESTTVRMFAGTEIPEAAWRGQMIYRTDTQHLQVYTGIGWEDVVGGVVGQLTYVGPEPPVGAQVNDLWYDSDNGHLLHQWSGTEWVPLYIGGDAIDPTYPTTINIAADQILNGTTLAADIVLTGSLTAIGATSAVVGLSGAGFQAYGPPDPDNGDAELLVSFPTDGSPSFTGKTLITEDLTITKGFKAYEVSELYGTLALASTVSDPRVAPQPVVGYQTLQLDLSQFINPVVLDFAIDFNRSNYWTVLVAQNYQDESGTHYTYHIVEYYPGTLVLRAVKDLPAPPNNGAWQGITIASSDGIPVYVLTFRATNGYTYARAFNLSLSLSSPAVQVATSVSGRVYRATIGYNHGTDNPMVAYHYNDDALLRWTDLTVTGYGTNNPAITVGPVFTQSGFGSTNNVLRGVAGQILNGRFWISNTANTVHFTDGTAHETVNGRGWRLNATDLNETAGLVYYLFTYFSISQTGLITRYENGDYYWDGADDRVWTATYTWYDEPATSHETGPSPVTTIPVPKRSRLTLTAEARPVVSTDTPTHTRFYVNSKAGGTQTLRYRYATTTANYWTFDGSTKETATTQAPTNNFPAGLNSSIETIATNSDSNPLIEITSAGFIHAETMSVGVKGTVIEGMRNGHGSYTTDGSSDVTIAHGLGTTPTHVMGTPGSSNTIRFVSADATNISFRCRVASTSALTGSGVSVVIYWTVYL